MNLHLRNSFAKLPPGAKWISLPASFTVVFRTVFLIEHNQICSRTCSYRVSRKFLGFLTFNCSYVVCLRCSTIVHSAAVHRDSSITWTSNTTARGRGKMAMKMGLGVQVLFLVVRGLIHRHHQTAHHVLQG